MATFYKKVVLLLSLLLGAFVVSCNASATARQGVARHPYHAPKSANKVRGEKRVLKRNKIKRRRILKGDVSDDSQGVYSDDKMSGSSGKGGGKGGSGSSSKKGSMNGKSKKNSKGKGGDKKSSKRSENIFDHSNDIDEVEMQEVQVECGTDESPFLTTFVASVRVHESPTRKSGKGSKGTKSSKSAGSKSNGKSDKRSSVQKGTPNHSVDQDDDYELGGNQDGDDDHTVVTMDDLTRNEQRILEQTFREVYNNWTFNNCDGFFRTVFTVSMTMVERDEEGEDYAVTLENMYRSGSDQVSVRVINGTLDMAMTTKTEDNDFNFDEEEDDMGGARWLEAIDNSTVNATLSAPSKEVANLARDGSSATYDQTIVGGDNLPIYYVSLAATCRNCEVTDEVNFPLLMIPEMQRRGRALQTANITREEQEEGEVCTCSLPVAVSEVEISRRRLDGHSLFVPQPMGPTPAQFIIAMNNAIRTIQRNEGQLLRIEGIEDLIEPDYFNGENPERERGPTNAPTISAMPSVSSAPSMAPTVSAAPTISSIPSSSPTKAPIRTPSPTSRPLSRPPSKRPTLPPITLTPTESPDTRSSAHCGWTLVMASLLGLAVTGRLWA